MSTQTTIDTPAQQLAQQIVERLVAARLMSAAEAAKLQPKLADGTLHPEDWQLAIELSAAPKVAS